MTIANASQTRLAFIEESVWGTTPATPVFENLRFTGESLTFDTETARSNEIRPDRNVSDLVRTGQNSSGGFNFELSYGSYDALLESLLQEAWTTDVLKNGVTPKSFSFEKTIEAGATDSFMRYVGMYVNQMSLAIEARKIITGSFGLIGKGGSVGSAIITGATYTDANTNEIMSASADFASLAMAGLTTPSVMRVNMTATNNMRPQPVVGDVELAGIGSGRFEVSGNLSAYFETSELYEAYLDGTASSLSFTLGAVANEKYTITIPRIKFESGNVQASGNDQDIMADLNFVALFDGTEEASLKVERAVA